MPLCAKAAGFCGSELTAQRADHLSCTHIGTGRWLKASKALWGECSFALRHGEAEVAMGLKYNARHWEPPTPKASSNKRRERKKLMTPLLNVRCNPDLKPETSRNWGLGLRVWGILHISEARRPSQRSSALTTTRAGGTLQGLGFLGGI